MENKTNVRDLAGLLSLDVMREDGRLDEVDLKLLNELQGQLLMQPPRVLIATMLTWNRQGRPAVDLRSSKIAVTSKQASPEESQIHSRHRQ